MLNPLIAVPRLLVLRHLLVRVAQQRLDVFLREILLLVQLWPPTQARILKKVGLSAAGTSPKACAELLGQIIRGRLAGRVFGYGSLEARPGCGYYLQHFEIEIME